MCFIIHPDYPNPLVAEQDIICFKIGKKAESNLDDQKFFSQYRSYVYRLGELQPKVELFLDRWIGHSILSVQIGYHSYHPLNPSIRAEYVANSPYCLVRCIIPKGSQYYYNPSDREYVSDQIIAQKIL